jgi:diacylglycerol O-acyltransferase / wax synthase
MPVPERELRGPGPLELRYLKLNPQVLMSGLFAFEIPAGGTRPTFAEIRQLVAARLHGPLRYRLRYVPARLAPPVWEETSVDLDHHLSEYAAGRVATLEELVTLAVERSRAGLDLDRPLWSLTFVEQLEGGCCALIPVVHHALTDAVGSLAILGGLLLDLTADAELPTAIASQPHRGSYSDADLVRYALRWQARRFEQVMGALRKVERAQFGAPQLETTARVVALLASRRRPPERALERFEVPLDGHVRAVGWDVPLADLRRFGRTLGATFNDVLLSAVAAGLREWFRHHDQDPVDVRASIPVRVNDLPDEPNPIMRVLVDLPVSEPDTLRRIRTIASRMGAIKSGADAALLKRVEGAIAYLPTRLHRSFLNLLYTSRGQYVSISNVPGPTIPLYLRGCQLKAAYATPTIGGSHRIAIATTTVGDRACVCFQVAGEVAGAKLIEQGMHDELDRLARRDRSIRAVRAAPLFAGFDDEQVLAIADAATETRYQPGEVVIRAGEHSTSLYILSEGEVDVETPDRVHRVLAAPNFFGELSLISGGERAATVRARTAVAVFVVERSVVAGLLAEDPMARELIAGLRATRPGSLRSPAIAG